MNEETCPDELSSTKTPLSDAHNSISLCEKMYLF